MLFTTADQVTAPLCTRAGPTASEPQQALNRVGDIETGGGESDQWELYAKGDDHENYNLVDVAPDAGGQPVPNQGRIEAWAKMGGEVSVSVVANALPGLVELLRSKLAEAGFGGERLARNQLAKRELA